MCGKPESCSIACSVVAIVLALGAIGMSGYTLYKQLDDEDSANLQLTDKSKMERAATSRTISLLTNETKELKVDYMNLLSETKALNKTINFTNSATVQRVLDELNHVKGTQRVIQKRLEALSHLNDTAEDYLNLREEVENLTTHVNQNINRLEGKVNEDRREWQEALENKTSDIDFKLSDLEKKLDREKLENTQNKTNDTSDATRLPVLRKVFYTIIFLTPLGISAYV